MADVPLQIPSRSIGRRSRLCVILAVVMQALDTTIANVALPYMQGSVSASADQINWVLTSYIVAAAIMTPPSGFLANRFGRKRVLMAAVAGFVSHPSCAASHNRCSEIVAFRLLQGFFGAALVPLGQVDPARHLYAGGTRLGDGAIRRIGHGGTSAGAGDRRLADRPLQLAMGLLYQRALWAGSHLPAYRIFMKETQDQRGSQARLARIWQPEHRYCRACRCFWTGVRNSTGSLPSRS